MKNQFKCLRCMTIYTEKEAELTDRRNIKTILQSKSVYIKETY